MATQSELLQRWSHLREMLIRQLAMFEDGALTLRSNDVDIAPAAIADLKNSIRGFDILISETALTPDTGAAPGSPT